MIHMLNLAYPITETVEINGKKYNLNMSFDNILRLFDLLQDDEFNDAQKVVLGLEMLVNATFDLPIEEQAEIFTELFKATIGKGQEDKQPVDLDGNPMPVVSQENKKVYDLVQDAEYIYASFMSDYGIDLFEAQGKLHWYKFKALLNGLTDKSKFMRVVEIRQAEMPKGKGMQKERERLRKLKEHYALKDE